MGEPLMLHFSVVERAGSAQQVLLFAHGILGSGANLRGIATRLVERDPSLAVALVDLRGHGRSPLGDGEQTLAACAADLQRLESALPYPVTGIVGHSFGGKVALAYYQTRPDLERVAILDSAPFARPERTGSEQTMRVLDMLDALPPSFATRDAFREEVVGHGHSRAIADWLAMNLTRTAEGFRLRTSLDQIRALLSDYFSADLWPVLASSRARTDVVIGGRSRVWGADDIQRARSLAKTSSNLRVHVLPDADHWVHVDDAEGVVAALSERDGAR